jgi:5-(carboxyamino)imidazole ribonucleotide mutase
MTPQVSIIMGSKSDLPIMEEAAEILNSLKIPFEINALSAHRTAGMAAHLPGVIASMTKIPVIGVPIDRSLSGLDALLSIVQMPPGIPVATVGINAAQNAGILASQILGLSDEKIAERLSDFNKNLKDKVSQANKDFSKVKYDYKVG